MSGISRAVSSIDMSIMGIGTNLLGYGHPEVDAAVAATVTAGNMSTLNCPEEVLLAERLVDLHPWAGNGALCAQRRWSNAIAIRIARAATGRETVAICGYHGWHDWYLATNLQNESGWRSICQAWSPKVSRGWPEQPSPSVSIGLISWKTSPQITNWQL